MRFLCGTNLDWNPRNPYNLRGNLENVFLIKKLNIKRPQGFYCFFPNFPPFPKFFIASQKYFVYS